MNFINRLKLFSLNELYYVGLTSIASQLKSKKLIEKIPQGLMSLQGLLVALERQNIAIQKYHDTITFNYTLNNKSIQFFIKRNSSDASVFKQVLLRDEYSEVINLIKKYQINVRSMIDAGANVGLSSVYFKSCFPDVNMICLEPSKTTFERLKKNVEENRLDNMHLLQKGLWSEKTSLFEDRSFRDKLDWSFKLSADKIESDTKIETTSVSDILQEYKLDYIDILKIDIEGAEKEVFNNKSSLDWLTQVRLICIEIHDEFNCRETIENILVKYGFELQHSGELTIGVNKKLLTK